MQKLFKNKKISQKVFIAAKDIPFNEKATAYCSANLCGRYAKTWSCPPAVGDYNTLKAKALSFKNAFVFTNKGMIEDINDEAAINKLREETMDILFDVIQKLKSNNIPHLALGCGSCSYCKECTYPDAPCRFPEKAIPPMEAYGVDVAELCKKTGMTYMTENNEVTFFCMVLY